VSELIQQRLSRLTALRPVRAAESHRHGVSSDLPHSAGQLEEMLGATTQKTAYGEHLLVRQWHSEPELRAAYPAALALLAPDAPPEAADPEQWLFLDTETTGLAGGTGTYAFLVGLAWIDAGGLQIEQLFMRDYSEEHAVLTALAERMAERRVLVTFNGRCFDWPLLETRYRMTRRIAAQAPAAHLDLLPPARQLWRLKLGSVRLAELERSVLGRLDWDRSDDIPGALIPQAYFEYLRGGAPGPLVEVLRHNRWDLRGLAALAARVLALVSAPEQAEGDALELYGLSRLLHRRGQAAPARRLYERALEAGLPAEADRAARRELASLAKRERDYGRATSLWTEILGGTRDGLDAYEQLAIYYEHHARAPHRAEELLSEALVALRHAWQEGSLEPARYRRLRGRLQHRFERVSARAARSRRELFDAPGGVSIGAAGKSKKNSQDTDSRRER
jgi:uncharacterized protein YprB with RNaseH-like and TPR domain